MPSRARSLSQNIGDTVFALQEIVSPQGRRISCAHNEGHGG